MESVGVIGGTGPLGGGLAIRLALAGADVLVGSRDPRRAVETATQLNSRLSSGGHAIAGAGNAEVGTRDMVVVAVPYHAVAETVSPLEERLRGRLLVSTAVPMRFVGGRPEPLRPEAGSAGEELAALCPESRVVGAFHTVAAGLLLDPTRPLDEDVLVSGDDPLDRRRVARLVELIPGLRAVESGPLASGRFSEALTPLLLQLNRLHRAHTGIRITGLGPPGPGSV